MTINEMAVDSFRNVEIGKEFTTREIRDIVAEKHGVRLGSFQPSDACYNRTNKGLDVSPSYNRADSRIFLWLRKGHYKYVGPGYTMPGNGIIYSDPRSRS